MSRAGAQPFLEKLVTISSENLARASGAMAPQQVHVDIAALVHGADARISRKPDARAMYAVIAEAGRRISGGKPGPELAQRITNAQVQIRHRLMLRRPALGLALRAARAVRGRLRRLMPAAQQRFR
jgi:hypothetical protein